MVWLQLSANNGPAECSLAVAKALTRLLRDAAAGHHTVAIVEQVDGNIAGTIDSVLLEISDIDFARQWAGTLLWICASPYRKLHKRKNWFISATILTPPDPGPSVAEGPIRFEALRASGPGGQHVNKTDSAIRATHVASGLSVKVQSERSQHANKRLAGQLLASKLQAQAQSRIDDARADRHARHAQGERGNAARVFAGADFSESR